MKKKFQKNNSENEVVKIILYSDTNRKKKYECVGVLLKEDDKMLRIGFNAVENVVKDYLDIDKKNMISMEKIEQKEIKHLF
ncbi:hypothetical protein L6261_03855 [Candidatus Parcubacteria bacterium]|nr:hypothetical protein [Candidatus Parcubacteria bacterium]